MKCNHIDELKDLKDEVHDRDSLLKLMLKFMLSCVISKAAAEYLGLSETGIYAGYYYTWPSLHSIRSIELALWFYICDFVFKLELMYNSRPMTTKAGHWIIHYSNGGALNFTPSGWRVQNVCKLVIHQTASKTTESVWHYTPPLSYFFMLPWYFQTFKLCKNLSAFFYWTWNVTKTAIQAQKNY